MLGDPDTLVHWPRPLTHAGGGALDRPEPAALRRGRASAGGPSSSARPASCSATAGSRPTHRGASEVELGYHFHRRNWGNGYADRGRRGLRRHRPRARPDPADRPDPAANVASQRVAQRVGFTPRAGRHARQHAARPVEPDAALRVPMDPLQAATVCPWRPSLRLSNPTDGAGSIPPHPAPLLLANGRPPSAAVRLSGRPRRPRRTRQVSERCCGITRASASTGMKFVSPAQRGHEVDVQVVLTPAPAARPRLKPPFVPCGW